MFQSDRFMAHYFWVPENLNLDELLEGYNFADIKGFHKDNLHYIVHLISELPATNKDIITENGYVPLHSTILRKWVPLYEQYRDCLIKLGVIETDGSYIIGNKSKGYGYCEKYRTGLKKLLVTDTALIKKLDEWYAKKDYTFTKKANKSHSEIISIEPEEGFVPVTQYADIAKWYKPDIIQIDADNAHAYNEHVYEDKFGNKDKWDRKYYHDGTYHLKDPYTQFIAGWRNIEKIRHGRYNLHADDNVYRLHSCITNCKKELRNFITLDGKPVTAVDLSNSQPTLLLILLNLGFWDNTGAFKSSDIPYLDIQSIFKDNKHLPILIKLLKNLQDNDSKREELNRYKELVVSGKFYDNFSALLKDKLGLEYSKEEIKPMMFTVMFTHNRYIHQPEAAPKREFRSLFPAIYEVLNCIKMASPRNLPILLQRIESYIMYYRICPEIASKMPNLPIVPIHDSIATVKGYEGFVEGVMKQELTRCIGVTPHVKKEEWAINQLLPVTNKIAA